MDKINFDQIVKRCLSKINDAKDRIGKSRETKSSLNNDAEKENFLSESEFDELLNAIEKYSIVISILQRIDFLSFDNNELTKLIQEAEKEINTIVDLVPEILSKKNHQLFKERISIFNREYSNFSKRHFQMLNEMNGSFLFKNHFAIQNKIKRLSESISKIKSSNETSEQINEQEKEEKEVTTPGIIVWSIILGVLIITFLVYQIWFLTSNYGEDQLILQSIYPNSNIAFINFLISRLTISGFLFFSIVISFRNLNRLINYSIIAQQKIDALKQLEIWVESDSDKNYIQDLIRLYSEKSSSIYDPNLEGKSKRKEISNEEILKLMKEIIKSSSKS